ncbi:EF-hand calcium-binding domain-containing protein 4A isoform X2 [Oncorhynchus tshawytscha]|nr:EF-hand calcium-binding domain-containing protein 4A isoform X2 [Oncorhynchus tshawytscha]XP_042175746.1 EF-hand calcium-binding domain-containing protein 4A isoform X2 [Oncorhynchus tshawytscha]XP_042175779.1 EF-hand calcium-binding domain-containing protein 4A isoform X2 [Oncorhynchus tshawytscha]
MSSWLKDGEVLIGEGSGTASPCSRRQRILSTPGGCGSLRPGGGGVGVRGHGGSPSFKEGVSGMVQPETMGKAKELFVLCDKEGKGFITKRDMQRLQGELPLSPEQLESVFESLDRDRNGFLTPVEFNMGLAGELMGVEESTEKRLTEREENEDLGELRFIQILTELGADKLFKDQCELGTLWCALQRDRPELLSILEDVLVHAVSHLQDSLRERDSLELALRRRESDHDRVVRSIYEEMESQNREEREKRLAQDSIRQWDRRQKIAEELKTREQELETTLAKQRELEARIQALGYEQADIRVQNQKLHGLNIQLQEQLETSREELQKALKQLQFLQSNTAQEERSRESVFLSRTVLKVSKNMQKEKHSLQRQLELLRDMNKRLRDEKDTHQSQKRPPNVRKPLRKKGSVIGNYILQDKPIERQLSSFSQSELELASDGIPFNSSKRRRAFREHSCDDNGRTEAIQARLTSTHPQRVFKVVFLGNSGVGKSSFINHYCNGHFPNTLGATVGVDFQMRAVTLGSTTIALQLWDTAGQERFRSITQQYYRKADGILTMYDITDSASFSAVRGWMDLVQERMSEGAVLMLLGNKMDLSEDQKREVTTREGQRLAEQDNAVFYECSARSGYNIEELMTQLAWLLSAQQDQQCEETLHLSADHSNRDNRKSCCK